MAGVIPQQLRNGTLTTGEIRKLRMDTQMLTETPGLCRVRLTDNILACARLLRFGSDACRSFRRGSAKLSHFNPILHKQLKSSVHVGGNQLRFLDHFIVD